MTRIRIIPALLGAAVLAACSKDGVQEITAPTAGAFIKFYNYGVNAPSVNFFANDTKLTAVSSTSCTPVSSPPNPLCASTGIESTTGTAYGAAGNGGLYSSIAPGDYSFSGRISAATDNGFSVAKISATLADKKHYSLYTSGFYNATSKSMEAFVVEDAFPEEIDFSKSSVRLVNAISNSSPMTLYAKNPGTGDSILVASSIAYKSAGPFVPVPGAVYDLTVRYAGSNTAIATAAAVSLSSGRAYSVNARGDATLPATGTAANRPILTTIANR